MRRILLLAVGLMLLALAGAALAPASLASLAVDRATRGAATLVDSEGTIWHGRATLVAGGAPLPLAWSVDPWSLVHGRIRLHLDARDAALGAPSGTIDLGRKDFELAGVEIAIPAAMLVTPAHAFVRPGGEIALTSPVLTWTPPVAAGNAAIVWRDAKLVVVGGGALALGTVTATLTAAGDRIAGPLINEGGDVDVGGNITLTAPAALDIALTIRARPGTESPIARTLAAFASPDDGSWRIRWHGDLR